MAMLRVATGLFIGVLAAACASTHSQSYRAYHYQVNNEIVEVERGHSVGPFENRGFCVRAVGNKDEEVGYFTASGTFDGTWTSPREISKCHLKGTATCAFADGSSFTDEATMTCHIGPDGNLVIDFLGDALMKGTGRFEGIQGEQINHVHKYLRPPPHELVYESSELRYTLPKK